MKEKPSIEERVAALEAGTGIRAGAEEPDANAVPGEPLKQHELYAVGDEEKPANKGSKAA